MGIASLIIGIAALVLYLITLVPYLGWLNIIVLPLAGVGFVLGIIGLGVALSRGSAVAGIVINGLVAVLGLMRLF